MINKLTLFISFSLPLFALSAPLSKIIGSDWVKYQKLGKKILCNSDLSGQPTIFDKPLDDYKATAIVKKTLNDPLSSIDEYTPKKDKSGAPPVTYSLSIGEPAHSQFDIKYIFNSDGLQKAIVRVNQITNSKGTNEIKHLFATHYNLDCKITQFVHWQRNSNNELTSRNTYNSKFDLINKQYTNPKIKSLQEIYKNCDDDQFKQIKKITQRTDRILVTVLDSGIDYNNKLIAYKIENMPIDEINKRTLEKTRNKIKNRIKILKKRLLSLKRKRKWVEKEYLSKISHYERKLKKLSVGWDYIEKNSLPYDFVPYTEYDDSMISHGTHVSGIIVNGSDDIKLLPLRTLKEDHSKMFEESIDLAHEKGSRIVNMSFGSSIRNNSLKRAIDTYQDMLFVTAAGNDELNLEEEPVYPAAYNNANLMTVGSVNSDNILSSFSNYSNKKVDIVAYGENVVSSTPGNKKARASGTSMSSAKVTAIAAQIKFINPKLSPVQIIDILKKSATVVESLKPHVKGGLVLNKKGALEMARKGLKKK